MIDYKPGDQVEVKIYSKDSIGSHIEAGKVVDIVEPHHLQWYRYNILLEDGTELKEVDPTCMKMK